MLPTGPKPTASSEGDETKVYGSPLAGVVVVGLHVKPGDRVPVDDLLLVLDAMKMEIKINAQPPGIVTSIEVGPNDAEPDRVLFRLE